jgi:hypothetical protein
VHGVIFTSLRDYVGSAHGAAAEAEVFAGEPAYVLGESYPDERFHELVRRTATVAGVPDDDVLERFGVFTVEHTFARLYPAFFEIVPSARAFLLTVETRIHELVRATIPKAEPPRLGISEDRDGGVRIRYESPRRLCVLLRGLVAGTALRYGEGAELEETQCMHDGAEACVFRVRLSRS